MKNSSRLLGDVNDIKRLAQRFSECSEIARYDSGEHNESWSLADGFSDLEQAFRAFLEDHLPKLTDPQLKCEEIVNVLLDIGEEFRTILWHIQGPQYYKYLSD